MAEMSAASALNDVEAAKLAVTVEKVGFAFYTEAAQACDSRQVARTFRTLAQQEEQHRARFEALGAALLTKHAVPWDDPNAEAYIRALIDTGIFPDVETAHSLAQVLETDEDALRLALKVEKDSVLFYTAAAGTAKSPESAAAFSKIADEEKTHVVNIQAQLAKLAAKPAQ